MTVRSLVIMLWLLAAVVFGRDAAGSEAAGSEAEERPAVLARYQTGQARRLARGILQTVREDDRTSFDEIAFETVIAPYRSGA